MSSYITPGASLVIVSSLALLSEEVNGFISVGLCWLLAFMPPACAKLTIEAGLGGLICTVFIQQDRILRGTKMVNLLIYFFNIIFPSSCEGTV